MFRFISLKKILSYDKLIECEVLTKSIEICNEFTRSKTDFSFKHYADYIWDCFWICCISHFAAFDCKIRKCFCVPEKKSVKLFESFEIYFSMIIFWVPSLGIPQWLSASKSIAWFTNSANLWETTVLLQFPHLCL